MSGEKTDYDSKAIIRFKNFVKTSNKCHLWTGHKDRDGYGTFRYKDKKIRSHRAAYQLFVGKIPDGFLVCHTCDTPSCVNPKHLFIGTNKDNVNDMWTKGRNSNNMTYALKAKRACINGHKFNSENTYYWRGHRRCKTCHRYRMRDYHERKKYAEA